MNPFDFPDTSQTRATGQAAKTPAEIIRAEAAKSGVLTFARFMELALYCPDCGYYETKKDSPGRGGDFYTSVSAGELFGQLLAFQFAEWLEEFQISNFKFQIVEAGAHNGKLAADILNWLKIHRPKLFEKIQYCIIEPSAARREWQKETLKKFPNVLWFSELAGRDSVEPKFSGIIFSNELLDAFPVHRFGWDAKNKKWFEWGVSLDGEKFVWAKIQPSTFNLQLSTFNLPPQLESVLPDNYTVEISPAAENWWREAATILERGKLLTIDYGLTDDELFLPERKNGTLRGFYRHHFADDLLANPGEQDLTVHVNFSTIQKAGESAGLTTELFSAQTKFLTRILEKALKGKSFDNWTQSQTRQFQTLTHPEHLGRAFRVLIQKR